MALLSPLPAGSPLGRDLLLFVPVESISVTALSLSISSFHPHDNLAKHMEMVVNILISHLTDLFIVRLKIV